MQLKEAAQIADEMLATILAVVPKGRRGLVVGSIRRKRSEPKDIDLVIEAGPADREAIYQRFEMKAGIFVEAAGPELFRFRTKGIAVDIYFARPDTREQHGNFGSIVLCRTGSRDHNIMIASLAKSLGRRWNIQLGIMKGDQVIAGATEEGLFDAIGMEWIRPENRERPNG